MKTIEYHNPLLKDKKVVDPENATTEEIQRFFIGKGKRWYTNPNPPCDASCHSAHMYMNQKCQHCIDIGFMELIP